MLEFIVCGALLSVPFAIDSVSGTIPMDGSTFDIRPLFARRDAERMPQRAPLRGAARMRSSIAIALVATLARRDLPRAEGMIHNLVIKEDARRAFQIETFGFREGGFMNLTVSGFSVSRRRDAVSFAHPCALDRSDGCMQARRSTTISSPGALSMPGSRLVGRREASED